MCHLYDPASQPHSTYMYLPVLSHVKCRKGINNLNVILSHRDWNSLCQNCINHSKFYVFVMKYIGTCNYVDYLFSELTMSGIVARLRQAHVSDIYIFYTDFFVVR